MDIENFSRLCRCCMKDGTIGIFDTQFEGYPIATILERCTGTTISIVDELPHNICQLCLDTLSTCHLFIEKYLEVENALLTILNSRDSKELKPNVESHLMFDINVSNGIEANIKSDVKISNGIIEESKCKLEFDESISINDMYNSEDEIPLSITAEEMEQEQEKIHEVIKSDTEFAINQSTSEVYNINGEALLLELNNERQGTTGNDILYPNGNEGRTSEGSLCETSLTQNGLDPPMEVLHRNGMKKLQCHLCENASDPLKSLDIHMNIHTEKTTEDCEESLSDTNMRSNEGFSCTHCDKSFQSNDSLGNQTRIHTGEKPFSCSICNKSFRESGHLKRHIRIHTREKPFQCSYCNKSFWYEQQMKIHMRNHTGEKPFSCSICNKSFIERTRLNSHMIIHDEKKPFLCTYCNKSFSNGNNMKIHIRKHTGEKPFTCSVCNKCFTESGSLKRHMRNHTGEKPFQCAYCNKSFSGWQNRKIHMRTHSGEKPFLCTYCYKSFSQQSNLKVHLRTHTREKPFSCTCCNKCFSRNEMFQRHMRTHT